VATATADGEVRSCRGIVVSVCVCVLISGAAIAFTYFEALVRQGDIAKFEEEEARLVSMHNLLNNAGFPHDVYIDWAEEAFELLHELAQSLRNNDGRAADVLLQKFNDEGVSLSIMTYFKVSAPTVRLVERVLTRPAACKRVGPAKCGQLQALRPHGRYQVLLLAQY
jgi:hypothetical protein